MGRVLRVGLVGFGWVNRQVWLPRLLERPACEVAALYDPALRARPLGLPAGCAVVGSLAELLGRGLDLAIVATPNHLHESGAGAVLDAGVAALVEKPLCLSTAQLDSLLARAEAAGRPLQVCRPSPLRQDVLALRRAARRHCTGPVEVTMEWLRTAGVPRPGSWFTRRAESGGGALLDLGWHLADLAQVLLPRCQPEVLEANLLDAPAGRPVPSARWRADVDEGAGAGTPEPRHPRRAHGRRSPAPGGPRGDESVDVEVDGSLRARYPDGSVLRLRAAWMSDVPVDTTRVAVRGRTAGGAECRFELVTTFGFSSHRVTRPVLRSFVDGRWREAAARTVLGAEYDAQLTAALGTVRGRTDWRAGLADAARVLTMLETAYRLAGRPMYKVAPAGAA